MGHMNIYKRPAFWVVQQLLSCNEASLWWRGKTVALIHFADFCRILDTALVNQWGIYAEDMRPALYQFPSVN